MNKVYMNNIEKTINNLKDCIKELEEMTKTHQENIEIFKTLIEQLEEWKEK